VAPPVFRGYKPYGTNTGEKEPVDLLYEEYEAIKLADYDLMNHQEASVLMGISRPTFARIYKSGRKKIALALVQARPIRTVYGNAWFDEKWFECTGCHARFTIPKTLNKQTCPLCGDHQVEPIKKHT